ncbi:MAG: hypothetical protein A2Y12_04170 [Planctomycetes bacterium GWF2_42_9]|nr:MAG: hypothetical protein A2Y12_04170 [Planctomycetes bacterium GWF2_42_9]HAL45730.1 hypothetical protein [Phycisphaerales bacterium]
MKDKTNIIICEQVKQIYDWLDSQIKLIDADCSACGKCCNFESFGHRLFVTSPELLYFRTNINQLAPSFMLGVQKVHKPLQNICPYLIDGKCTAREFRFSGCRIFFCKGDIEKQNALYEETIKKFKALCDDQNFPYQYMELSAALNQH